MLKKLMEQRAEKQSAMQALLDKAKTENRAMTDEEQASRISLWATTARSFPPRSQTGSSRP